MARVKRKPGSRTRFGIYQTLNACFNYAVKKGWLEANLMRRVDRPRYQRVPVKWLTKEQIKQLLQSVKTDIKKLALLNFAITTGLREGELLGLTWDDLDYSSQSIFVQKQAQYNPEEKELQERDVLKTETSFRRITIGPKTLELMKKYQIDQQQHKKGMGKRWQENNLIFPSSVGTYKSPRNLLREFKKTLEYARLPTRFRFHDLRHTSASLMINRGAHPKAVSERLGHSHIRTTLDLYSHLMPTIQSSIADLLDEILNDADGSQPDRNNVDEINVADELDKALFLEEKNQKNALMTKMQHRPRNTRIEKDD